jgi:hypothetical protein
MLHDDRCEQDHVRLQFLPRNCVLCRVKCSTHFSASLNTPHNVYNFEFLRPNENRKKKITDIEPNFRGRNKYTHSNVLGFIAGSMIIN